MANIKTSLQVDSRTSIEIASQGPSTTLSIFNRVGDGPTANLSDDNLADLIEILVTVRKARDRSA